MIEVKMSLSHANQRHFMLSTESSKIDSYHTRILDEPESNSRIDAGELEPLESQSNIDLVG
jgi:hypothetical protein